MLYILKNELVGLATTKYDILLIETYSVMDTVICYENKTSLRQCDVVRCVLENVL